jgi:lipopolysaccharide transport system permease protein
MSTEPAVPKVMEFDGSPASRRTWLGAMWAHREVLVMLARADFHVRYKRATFGIVWAVAVPVIQAAVLAVVFSRLIKVSTGAGFGAYVLAGVLAWSYFSTTLATASISIVEGASLTDKVWFPRAMLPVVPALANLVGFGVSIAVLVVALPLLGASISLRLLLLPVAAAQLLLFTVALSTLLASLHVYFRDVKFIVQAALLVWFYVTPIAYPKHLLGGLAKVVDLNPMTGVATLFQMAAVGHQPGWVRPVVVSAALTVVLALVAVEVQRRRDRLFVDLL